MAAVWFTFKGKTRGISVFFAIIALLITGGGVFLELKINGAYSFTHKLSVEGLLFSFVPALVSALVIAFGIRPDKTTTRNKPQ